jgi:RNA-directed DNA polymerase
MIMVRYADDLVVALSLRPDKTRVVEFGRHAAADRERCGLGKPETFNFLGFIFISAKSRGGGFLIKRRSRHDRLRAKLEEALKRRTSRAG